MKIPLGWLREYVDVEASADEIARKLTFSGTEVEGVRRVGSEAEGVIVAEILTVAPHPADPGLSVVTLDDGRGGATVVCGAKNVREGARAAYAPPGARLHDGRRMEMADLKGVRSAGMLCAEDELGITEDHSGLAQIDASATPGAAIEAFIPPAEDVLDVEITWNRPDCLSLIGMAREIAALYRRPLVLPLVRVGESDREVEGLATVSVEAPDLCPRYTARVLDGARIGPAPLWMRRRLHLAGLRAISNAVDITNYVMLECGQPLHAFDFTLLEGRRIVVRRSLAGESITTLDGVKRPLPAGTLVIADAARPVAVAGVMGGEGSEIRPDTKTILLESAAFAAPQVHRASMALGLASESSRRFERAVDVTGCDWASRRAAALLGACAETVAARGVIDVFPAPPAPKRIACRYERVRRLIGIPIADDEVTGILRSLQFDVTQSDAGRCQVTVPAFRSDVEVEADLVEEVARVHGLDEVAESLPAARIDRQTDDRHSRVVESLRTTLAGLGLHEVLHYSFVAEALLRQVPCGAEARRVVLPNPVSADHGLLRDALIPQMVETLGRNRSRQIEDAALFEIGRVFFKGAEGLGEDERISLGLMGRAGRAALDLQREVGAEESFLRMKGILEALVEGHRLGSISFDPAEHPAMDAAYRVTLNGHEAGVAGLIRRAIREEWRIQTPVAVAELSVKALVAALPGVPAYRGIPSYPYIRHDVAMIVKDHLKHDQIVEIIRQHAPPELTHVQLFDIFTGRTIGEGRKSLAFALIYRANDRTLREEDALGFDAVIKEALKRELGAEIREG